MKAVLNVLLKFNFDLQFYNPNIVNGNLIFALYLLGVVQISSELINENLTARFGASVHPSTHDSYQFTPGVSTIPASSFGSIDNPQNIKITSLPDGTYTVSFLHSSIVSGFPLVLEVIDGEIIPKISEPNGNYGKQGTISSTFPISRPNNTVSHTL